MKKILTAFSIFLLIIFINAPLASSEKKYSELYPVKVNGKWGFIDRTGKVVVKPKYDKTERYCEGMVAVNSGGEWKEYGGEEFSSKVFIGGKWGFIDDKGDTILDFSYNRVGDFSEGMARVKEGGEYVFQNVEYSWQDPYTFTGGKWGFIDRNGKISIKPKYEDARSFSNGLAAVKINGKWGYINKKGKLVIKSNFTSGNSFSEGMAIFENKDSEGKTKYGYVDTKGIVMVDPVFAEAKDFKDGVAPVCPINDLNWEDMILTVKWGLIDKSGKYLIPPEYDLIHDPYDGFVIAEKDQEFFVADINGNILFSVNGKINELSNSINKIHVNEVYSFKEGRALVRTNSSMVHFYEQGWKRMGGYWGFIDKTGEVVLEPKYADILPFSENKAAFRSYIDEQDEFPFIKTSKSGYLNLEGKVIIEPKFDVADPFYNGIAKVYIFENENYDNPSIGYINETGKYIWEPTK
jgi:predicted DNA-binding WGR domain protein